MQRRQGRAGRTRGAGRWTLAAFLLITLHSSAATPAAGQAQTRGSSVRARAPRPTRTTVNGTIRTATPGSITFATDDSKVVSAVVLATTKISRSLEQTGQDFAPGEKIVARIATYPDGRVTLVQIWDVEMHRVQEVQRRTITVGKVIEMRMGGAGSGDLVVEAADAAKLTFRVTPKTVWFKANALAASSAFPVGASVAVRPRALPSGGIMAGIVADTANGAEQAYRDTLTIWRGKATTVDAAQFFVTLARTDHVTRTLWIPPTLTIGNEKDRWRETGDRRQYKLSELAGLLIVARIQRDAPARPDGRSTVKELTVWVAPPSATPPAPAEAVTAAKPTTGKP